MLEANLFRFTLSAAAENKKFEAAESFLISRFKKAFMFVCSWFQSAHDDSKYIQVDHHNDLKENQTSDLDRVYAVRVSFLMPMALE